MFRHVVIEILYLDTKVLLAYGNEHNSHCTVPIYRYYKLHVHLVTGKKSVTLLYVACKDRETKTLNNLGRKGLLCRIGALFCYDLSSCV